MECSKYQALSRSSSTGELGIIQHLDMKMELLFLLEFRNIRIGMFIQRRSWNLQRDTYVLFQEKLHMVPK
jgi:hypothetical protein